MMKSGDEDENCACESQEYKKIYDTAKYYPIAHACTHDEMPVS